LGFTRLLVLAITLAAAVFTFGNMQSLVLDWNFLSMGLRGAGVFLPLTVAVFWPGWIYRPAAIGSMVAGVGVSLAWKGLFPQGLDPLFAGLAASGVLLISGWLLAKGQRTAETRAAGRHG
jgi:SSS family solute:Na+ symporter